MPRPDMTQNDRERLRLLEKTRRELEATERKLDGLRTTRNGLIYRILDSRTIGAKDLAPRAGVTEQYAYRCLHAKGTPKSGGRK